MIQPIWINEIADKLEESHQNVPVIVGFDGFVDEIIHVVDERQGPETFSRIPTIADLAERISSLAGLSGNLELVTLQSKLGGNGPIMANALISLGHQTTYMGAIGKDEVHPLFQDFSLKCERVISVCDPAHTDALEFSDGKLMLGRTSILNGLNWELFLEHISYDSLKELVSGIGLVSFTNWTMLHGMNSIIQGFTNLFRETGARPFVFFDLADPSKRTDADILELFGLLGDLSEHVRVILGMNMNESSIISRLTGVDSEDLPKRAEGIREALGIEVAVIHPTHGAAAADANGSYWVDGPYTDSPKLTTGAGDNFNAGFCHGKLIGLETRECLLSGVSTSGFYVRNARSPESLELPSFMRNWTLEFK